MKDLAIIILKARDRSVHSSVRSRGGRHWKCLMIQGSESDNDSLSILIQVRLALLAGFLRTPVPPLLFCVHTV